MKLSKDLIVKEAAQRKAALEAATPIVLNPNFPKQNAFIEDPARYIDVQCSRRAGKTNGLAYRYFRTMEKHPKTQQIYLGLTLESAREILWPVLQEINDKHNIGCTFVESKLTMTHPNGATLKLFGADMKNFIKRLKGRKYPGVGIDEAQDFGTHLQSLIDDVLTPSISDYADGWLALTGTPGPVPQGYFFDVTQNGKYGFSHHAWTILDNPNMPNPEAFIADLMKRREWTEDNPTLQREWRNKWVLDVNSLWVRYSEKTNHFDKLPDHPSIKWNYILGIDIGFNDADALAVIAWSEQDPTTYLVEEKLTRKQGLTELVEQIQAMEKKYNVYKMVIDEGGLGKKLAEEVRRRHAIPVEAADKARKQENVELLNDQLRTGKFKARNTSQFALDSYLVQIDWEKSTPNRIVVKKKPHSDIIDAVLYAFKESYSYSHEPAKNPTLEWGSKEWADQQDSSMFEAELEGHLADESYKNWLEKDGYGPK